VSSCGTSKVHIFLHASCFCPVSFVIHSPPSSITPSSTCRTAHIDEYSREVPSLTTNLALCDMVPQPFDAANVGGMRSPSRPLPHTIITQEITPPRIASTRLTGSPLKNHCFSVAPIKISQRPTTKTLIGASTWLKVSPPDAYIIDTFEDSNIRTLYRTQSAVGSSSPRAYGAPSRYTARQVCCHPTSEICASGSSRSQKSRDEKPISLLWLTGVHRADVDRLTRSSAPSR
jgi:hypothetical protein